VLIARPQRGVLEQPADLSVRIHERHPLRVSRMATAVEWQCSSPPSLVPSRTWDGIFVAPFEQGKIGPDLFEQACKFGLEGLISKRKDRPYRAGRSADWLKVKIRKHPAMSRVADSFA
jgi:hypothetical protein